MAQPRWKRRARLPLACALAGAVAGAGIAARADAQAYGSRAGPERLTVEARADLEGFAAPGEVAVRLSRPAYVAVFEIRPGLGTLLRYPRSRRQPNALPAGVHRIGLEAGRGELGDGFRRLPGYSDLPALGRLSPLDLGFLGRPFLLVVASADALWLSGRYLGRVVQPREVFPSLGLLVDDVLRDVLPHPQSGAWTFDLVPARPLLHPLPYGGFLPSRRGIPPGSLLPPLRPRDEPPRRGRDPEPDGR